MWHFSSGPSLNELHKTLYTPDAAHAVVLEVSSHTAKTHIPTLTKLVRMTLIKPN